MRRTLAASLVGVAAADQWAVIMAGSNTYGNYRHQADACHAYQIAKKNGVLESNIILLAYDDIAHNSDNPFPLRRRLSYGPSWSLLAAAMGRHGDAVALWDVRARGDRGAVGAVRAPGAVGWLHLDESQALAGHLLLSTAGGTQVAVYDVRRLAPAGSAPRPVARLAVPAGAAVACFAAEGDAAVVGGGPRSSVAWAYSGLRSEAFFEAAAAPRVTAAAKASKPKRQSRQHEKATKSKVKYGSRR